MPPFATLLLLCLVAFPLVTYTFLKNRRSQLIRIRPSRWIYAIAALPGLFFFLILSAEHDGFVPISVFLAMALFALGIYVWIREIVQLMGLSDEALPGRNDKTLWLALMVLLPPIGVPAFCWFRRAYWSVKKPTADAVAREMA